MSGRSRSPRTELLARLLEAHERSVFYSKPGPWTRDVILKFDAPSFPAAFAPDGLELRRSLAAAASELAMEGCVRIVRHTRGPLAGDVQELRLGPEELSLAYEAARTTGFEPLATGLRELEQHAAQLATLPAPSWLLAYLGEVAQGARDADTSVVAMSRERFKRGWRELLPALTAAAGLARGVSPAWERVVSERLLGDSKLLSRVRPQVIAALVRADPRWEGVPPDEATDLLEAYGVRRKPGLLRCAGMATLDVRGRSYRLEDFEPVAHLPDAWAVAWVDAIVASGAHQITTVENEFPFLAYVEERGGPEGLGAGGEIVVYTAGFPTPSLVAALASLAERSPHASFRHWGDADVGGLRIWWFLRSRLKRPIALFRTTAAWVHQEAALGGKELSDAERRALNRFRAELAAEQQNDDVVGTLELVAALQARGIKIEQERY